jgi:hypothetical protein
LAELPFDHGDPLQLAPNLHDPDLDGELEPELDLELETCETPGRPGGSRM